MPEEYHIAHMVVQFCCVSVQVHTVSMANAVCNDGLSYPGSSIGRVQGLGGSECLVGQLSTRQGEEDTYIAVLTYCCTD